MLHGGKAEDSFKYLTKLMVKYTEDENKSKKIEKLYAYLFDKKIG